MANNFKPYHFQASTFSWVASVGFFSQQLIDGHQSCLLDRPSYSMHFFERRFSRPLPPLVKGLFLVKNSGIRGFHLRSLLFLWKFAFFAVSVAERWCLLRLRPYSVDSWNLWTFTSNTTFKMSIINSQIGKICTVSFSFQMSQRSRSLALIEISSTYDNKIISIC